MKDFNFDQKKEKKIRKKKSSFVKCIDCRALIEEKLSDRYPTCPFCGGANWSDDSEGRG